MFVMRLLLMYGITGNFGEYDLKIEKEEFQAKIIFDSDGLLSKLHTISKNINIKCLFSAEMYTSRRKCYRSFTQKYPQHQWKKKSVCCYAQFDSFVSV